MSWECADLTCFYCDKALDTVHEHDHFPLPKRLGGVDTVPTCRDCHNLKDRVRLGDWEPADLLVGWASMNPLGRILASRILDAYIDSGIEPAARCAISRISPPMTRDAA
jgi:hypothetical protein